MSAKVARSPRCSRQPGSGPRQHAPAADRKLPVNSVVLIAATLFVALWICAHPPRSAAQNAVSQDLAPAGRLVEIIVEVPPGDLGGRSSDLAPAELVIGSSELQEGETIDLATLEVVPWNVAAHEAKGQPLPLRWYDDAIGIDFLEAEQNAHSTNGVDLTYTPRPRWGDFYNVLGDARSGRLVWVHTQQGNLASTYRVSFRAVRSEDYVPRLAPKGLVGNGAPRCTQLGSSTTGMIHSRVDVVDWNHDGLLDLLVGGSKGQVLFYRNLGTKINPVFGPPRLVLLDDGRPLDVGWSSAPRAIDWNQDGKLDLLSGAERNRILFFANAGSNETPRLTNQGFVRVGDQPIELPITPVPNSPENVYTLDYYPVLEAVDWEGDGDLDLLAGGYVTGRIFLFINQGSRPGTTPDLMLAGPIEADGQPLNVGDWAASPTLADFDGDGDLDLVSGNLPVNAKGGDAYDRRTFLRYYENVGSRSQPRLSERPFPAEGPFPGGALASPRAADYNGDGLVDLVVSANENIYLFTNVGDRRAPKFKVDVTPLPSEWGTSSLPIWGMQFLDWDRDGDMDLFSTSSIYLRDRDEFVAHSLIDGPAITHPGASGDEWTFTQLADLDRDGRIDLLFGTHSGNVYWHRNIDESTPGSLPIKFDTQGEMLLLKSGGPIQVGPTASDPVDFNKVQGARTAIAVSDFDGDTHLDLAVGDTFGQVFLFRNTGDKSGKVFLDGQLIANQGIRTIPFASDWDGDGQTDLIAAAANGTVEIFMNQDGKFSAGKVIELPPVPYSPFAAATDFNQDGDTDLVVATAYGYWCFFDRSFLEHGYTQVTRLK